MTDLTRRNALRAAALAALASQLPNPAYAAPGAVQAYDDGNTSIPDGLVGDPDRVIVIGAGWAGLTLANALRTAGVDHVVLEGRHRIGGRAHTVDVADFPVDLGCSWIHQPIGNPMSRWASQAGAGVKIGDVELDYPVIRYFDGVLGREVGLVEKIVPITQFLAFANVGSALVMGQLGPHASVKEGWEAYADQQLMTAVDRRRGGFVTRGFSEMVYGRHWSELSLEGWSWATAESDYFGIGEGNFPRGGYRKLYEPMAGSGEVRFGHAVRAIEAEHRGVVVHATHRGRDVRLRGSHVVVTVPLGVLKGGDIHFAPGLPGEKLEAIRSIGFGYIEKVVLAFKEPFWSNLTHRHILHESRAGDLAFPWWIDLNRTHGFPGLMAFNGGPFAEKLNRMTPQQRKEKAVARLEEIHGRRVPEPVAGRATSWQGDRFSQGSYSAPLAGRTGADLDALAAPVRGRVLFAGEATSRLRHSKSDGGFSSGIREAKRLLQAPSVGLRVD